MTALATRFRALRHDRSEDGFVMVIVILMLTIAIGFGAAALAGTISSRNYANKDMRAKRAVAAADAGIQAMLYQQNQLPLKNLEFNGGPLQLSTFLDCVMPTFDINLKVTGVATTNADFNGVCPVGDGPGITSSSVKFPVGNHASYQARFIPGATNPGGGQKRVLNSKIVSVGIEDKGDASNTSGYVLRRVMAVLRPLNPFQAVEASGNFTMSGVTVLNISTLATLNGNVSANGDVSVPLIFANTNLSGGLFGSVTYGNSITPGISLSHVSHASNTVDRQAVTISPAKSTCPAADTSIPRLANCGDLGSHYISATKSFSLTNSDTVTFPPGDYVFCNFNATSGTVRGNPGATAPVRIFIDSPTSARCSGNPGSQGSFVATNGIGNLLSNAIGVTGSSGMQIYVVGGTGATVNIGSPAIPVVQSMFVYAPTTDVTVNNCTPKNFLGTNVCAALQGNVIGKNVTIGASLFTQNLDLTSYPIYEGLGAFSVQHYVECTPVFPLPSPDPTVGC